MPDITTLISLFVAGAFISYMVGLIGAPSGTMYIPFLLIALPYLYPPSKEHLVPIVMATATICMIANIMYNAFLAFKEKQIQINAIQNTWWMVVIGGFSGALLIYFLKNQVVLLKILLGLILLTFSINMWNHLEPEDDKEPIETKNVNGFWFFIAAATSSAFGVGGQPYLWIFLKKLYYTYRSALGTARLFNLISMLGSLVIYIF